MKRKGVLNLAESNRHNYLVKSLIAACKTEDGRAKIEEYVNSKSSIQKEFNIRDGDDNEIDTTLYAPVSLVIKVKNKPPPKPGLKCHFCMLKYCLEEERGHEEFWHSNKIKP